MHTRLVQLVLASGLLSRVVCMSRILSMYTCTLEYYVHHDVFIRNECEGRYGWELAAVSGQDAGRQQCTLLVVEYVLSYAWT